MVLRKRILVHDTISVLRKKLRIGSHFKSFEEDDDSLQAKIKFKSRMLLFSFEGGVVSSIFVRNKKTAHQ